MAGIDTGTGKRIYLDNAATSWPKCEQALAAAERFMRHCGATSGRGTYGSALEADRWLERARTNLAKLIGASRPSDVAVCHSGTHALNAALWGVLRAGDHVVTTSMEHNSVLRPLRQMEQTSGVTFTVVKSDSSGRADPVEAESCISNATKLLVVGHASNVTGAAHDLKDWGELAERHDVRLLVDASQTVGYVPIDVVDSRIDMLAAAGHKGIRALAGTGFLWCAQELHSSFRPLMYGGTGRSSDSIDESPLWPQCIEVGNLNLPGVVSMAVAAEELLAQSDLMAGWSGSFLRLVSGLRSIPGVKLVGFDASADNESISQRLPVVSLQIDGWDAHDLGTILDDSFKIECRAGWHCAALVHRDLGTVESSGTLRLSPGRATSAEEIDYTLQALREILS